MKQLQLFSLFIFSVMIFSSSACKNGPKETKGIKEENHSKITLADHESHHHFSTKKRTPLDLDLEHNCPDGYRPGRRAFYNGTDCVPKQVCVPIPGPIRHSTTGGVVKVGKGGGLATPIDCYYLNKDDKLELDLEYLISVPCSLVHDDNSGFPDSELYVNSFLYDGTKLVSNKSMMIVGTDSSTGIPNLPGIQSSTVEAPDDYVFCDGAMCFALVVTYLELDMSTLNLTNVGPYDLVIYFGVSDNHGIVKMPPDAQTELNDFKSKVGNLNGMSYQDWKDFDNSQYHLKDHIYRIEIDVCPENRDLPEVENDDQKQH